MFLKVGALWNQLKYQYTFHTLGNVVPTYSFIFQWFSQQEFTHNTDQVGEEQVGQQKWEGIFPALAEHRDESESILSWAGGGGWLLSAHWDGQFPRRQH